MQVQRINSFDILKTISIFLVIFCHFPLLPQDSIIGNIIMMTSWLAVPCFMMVSGILVGRKEKADISWCIQKIAIVYIGISAWHFIYLIIQILFFNLRYGLKDIFCCVFLFKSLEGATTDVTWYMQSYIFVMMFTPIISYLYHQGKNGKRLLFYIMSILFVQSILLPELSFWISTQFAKFGSMLPFNYFGNMLFFYILGIICFDYKDTILCYLNRVRLSLIFVVGLVILIFTRYAQNDSFRWDGVYLENGYNRIGTIIMAFALFALICYYEQPKWIEKISGLIGKNTLGIYYWHYLLLMLLSRYTYHYLESYRSVMLNIVKVFVLLIVSNLLTEIMKKFPGLRKIV